MTTLTEKDVIGMARTIADQDKVDPYLNGMVTLTTEELTKFAHLCRADLVAENERLNESLLAEQAMVAMQKGMVAGLIERRRLDEESMKAADGKGYVFP